MNVCHTSVNIDTELNALPKQVDSLPWTEATSNSTNSQNMKGVFAASYLENIFHHVPVAIIALDNDGYVSYCNDMATTFFHRPIVGQLWRLLIERCFISGADHNELELTDGRIVKMETAPLDGNYGQVLVFSDVSKEREIRNIRDQYSRLASLGEMAASLAHQIRTPLAASILFLSNTKKVLTKFPDTYASLVKGLSSLKHIEIMIEDMLMFTKGGRRGDEKIEVAVLVNEIKQEAVVLMEHYPCAINVNDETDGLVIEVNHAAFRAAISNIIVNAAQACNDRQNSSIDGEMEDVDYQGKVNITLVNNTDLTSNNEVLTITIKDNGVGINEEELIHIHDPFFTTKSNGTGLGLTVTKSVLEAHGGSLDIRSIVNEGTVIKLTLPAR